MSGRKTFTAGSVLTAADVNGYLMDQAVQRFANAAARAAAILAPAEGMVCYLDDLNVLQVYSSAAWSTIGPVHGALTSWTPTVTQSGAVTVTNNGSTYTRLGRLIVAFWDLTVTGSGTAVNAIVIGGLPATAAAAGAGLGSAEWWDNSAALGVPALPYLASTTTIKMRPTTDGFTATTAALGVDVNPSALASPDTLKGHIIYAAAADA